MIIIKEFTFNNNCNNLKESKYNSHYCLQGSNVDDDLDDFTYKLSKEYCNRYDDVDAAIMYYFTDNSNYIVFIVFKDLYSGVVKAASRIAINDFNNSTTNINTVFNNMKKVNSNNAHSVAKELSI